MNPGIGTGCTSVHIGVNANGTQSLGRDCGF